MKVLGPLVGPGWRIAVPLALALAALAVAAPLAVSAQDAASLRMPPAEAGMSASALEGAAGLYREAVERGDLVGAVLLVAKDGKIVLHEAIGWLNIPP